MRNSETTHFQKQREEKSKTIKSYETPTWDLIENRNLGEIALEEEAIKTNKVNKRLNMSCMAALRVLREEFRLNKVGFGGIQTERLYIFQWRLPPFVYLLYRLVLSIYTLTWLSIIHGNKDWGNYLTNVSYTALTTYLLTHCVTAFLYHGYRLFQGESWLTRPDSATHNGSFKPHVTYRPKNNENGEKIENSNMYLIEPTDLNSKYYLRIIIFISQGIVWLMFNVVSTAALLVTIVYWTVLSTGTVEPDDIQLHILNTVFVLLEHCVTGVPVRLLHVIYPIIYSLAYCMFTLIYWTGDNSRVIYSILDWNNAGATVGFMTLIGLIIIPLLHLSFYGIYRIKVVIHQKLCLS